MDRTLNTKSILFLLITDIITVMAVVVIGFILFRDYTNQEHIRMAEGLTGLVADILEADKTLEYIEKGHDVPGYDETAGIIKTPDGCVSGCDVPVCNAHEFAVILEADAFKRK